MRNLLSKIEQSGDSTKHLIIYQCMGTLAGLVTLRELEETEIDAKLVAISPPLPSPESLLQMPASSSRRTADDSIMKIKRFSGEISDFTNIEEITARIPNGYLDVGEDFADFSESLKNLVRMGRVGIVAGTRDWNSEVSEIATIWKSELVSRDDPANDNVLTIQGAGHSLNPDRKATGGTRQREACTQALELGLRIISER